ncbi:MAG: Vitamin K-dependent gamma-carboxylase [Acidimicrobiales bacterium]|nr:Vitamin K-dependent gamma-carboxylase [Acidimicrobiales bacterium]
MTSLAAAWNRFWFEPTPTSTLGVLRIAAGTVMFAWALSLAPDLSALYSRAGIVPGQPHFPYQYGLLRLWPGDAVVAGLYTVLLLSTLCLVLGYHTRLSAVVVWLMILSFQRRNPWLVNSGDILLRDIAFFLMLAPAGASLSLDRWRRARDRFWEFPARAPWALRLLQVELCLMYFFTVWHKARGPLWDDGTAVSYALRLADVVRFQVPVAVSGNLLIANILTYGTMLTEVSLVVLVWNRKARPWVLGLGLAMHLAIGLTIMIGFFSLAIFAAYVAWVPPDTMARVVLRGRDRARAARLRRRFAGQAP